MADGEIGFDDGVQDLGRLEHLLVWSLRATAVGQGDCPLVCRAYAQVCGPAGAHALGCWFAFLRCVGQASRRRLKVHLPGCPAVSGDERAVVGVIAAAQESLRDCDEAALRSRLRWLMAGEPAEVHVFAAQAVARVLEDAGLRLAVPQPPEPPIEAAFRVVH